MELGFKSLKVQVFQFKSFNCDGRGGQTVSPQFSPIKKLHGILTELTDETGDNLDEEFNIQGLW